MEITEQIKSNVVEALIGDMEQRGFKSQAEYSKFIQGLLDIKFDKTALSQIKKPEGRKAIKEASWLRLARHFNVLNKSQWCTAKTHVYLTVNTILDLCKTEGIWKVLCDGSGLGKTYAAVEYARQNKRSVIYVDCSQCGNKQNDFISEVAKQFGMQRTTTYHRLWCDVMDELLLLDHPLLILDEFGDVGDPVVTLLKALYNKADMGDRMAVGCYFIGSNNLKKKLTTGRKGDKQSYEEFWNRFDSKITTLNFSRTLTDFQSELKKDIEMIVDENLAPDLSEKRSLIVENCLQVMSVRQIRKEISVQRKKANKSTI